MDWAYMCLYHIWFNKNFSTLPFRRKILLSVLGLRSPFCVASRFAYPHSVSHPFLPIRSSVFRLGPIN